MQSNSKFYILGKSFDHIKSLVLWTFRAIFCGTRDNDEFVFCATSTRTRFDNALDGVEPIVISTKVKRYVCARYIWTITRIFGIITFVWIGRTVKSRTYPTYVNINIFLFRFSLLDDPRNK